VGSLAFCSDEKANRFESISMLMAAAMEALDMPCSPSFVNAEMLISENALKAVRKILFLGKNKT